MADPINTGANFNSIVAFLIAFFSKSAPISSSARYNSSISWSKSAKVSISSNLFSSTYSKFKFYR